MSAPNSLNEAMARLDVDLAAVEDPHPPPPPAAAAAAAPPVLGAAPAALLGAAGNNSNFLNFKRSIIDVFDHWHTGWDAIRNYDRAGREQEYKKIRIPPRSGAYPGLQWPPEGDGGGTRKLLLVAPTASSGGSSSGGVVVVSPPRGFRERLRRHRRRHRRRFERSGGGEDEQEGESRGRQRRRRPRSYLQEMEKEQRKVTRNLGKALAEGFRPAGWAFKRILGAGGYGVVFLFEMVSQDGERVPVVVKGSLRKGPDGAAFMQKEAENVVRMAGARHFIQRVVTSDLPLPRRMPKANVSNRFPRLSSILSRFRRRSRHRRGSEQGRSATGGDRASILDDDNNNNNNHGPNTAAFLEQVAGSNASAAQGQGQGQNQNQQEQQQPEEEAVPEPGYTPSELQSIQDARQALDSRTDILVLENMPRGSVHHLIGRLVATKQHLSNRMLWSIFQCLFQSCVAMAYPHYWWEDGKNPWRQTMRQRDERVPGSQYGEEEKLPERPMVHFDLDPQNVLIGGFGEAGEAHSSTPIFKVADPGLSEVVEDHTRMTEESLWAFRTKGKFFFLSPEQFARDWDYQASTSLEALRREPVAGNYHWWTNLFGIGWIMWSLMTHCYPPIPAEAAPYYYHEEDSSAFNKAGDDDDADAEGSSAAKPERVTFSGWTYGALLTSHEQYNRYDPMLRLCVQRCLDHDPAARPELAYLQFAIEYFVTNGQGGHSAESDQRLRRAVERIFGGP